MSVTCNVRRYADLILDDFTGGTAGFFNIQALVYNKQLFLFAHNPDPSIWKLVNITWERDYPSTADLHVHTGEEGSRQSASTHGGQEFTTLYESICHLWTAVPAIPLSRIIRELCSYAFWHRKDQGIYASLACEKPDATPWESWTVMNTGADTSMPAKKPGHALPSCRFVVLGSSWHHQVP